MGAEVLTEEDDVAIVEIDEPSEAGKVGVRSSRPVEGCGSRPENRIDAGRSRAAINNGQQLRLIRYTPVRITAQTTLSAASTIVRTSIHRADPLTHRSVPVVFIIYAVQTVSNPL